MLNSGKPINYALGLFWATYRGLRVVGHDGALFGYRTQILRFPEQKFSVLCLCNLSNANPGNLAREVADVYLAKELQRADGMSDLSGNNYSPNAAAFAGKIPRYRNHREMAGWGLEQFRVSEWQGRMQAYSPGQWETQSRQPGRGSVAMCGGEGFSVSMT